MPDPARLFGVAPGVDYPTALVQGLADRLPNDDPLAWARTTIYVNADRMRRRIREVFDKGPARLLPQMRLITDLDNAADVSDVPQAIKPLHLKLDLAELILSLIERDPGLAPRSAAFDLAESLAALLDEMHGEGVGPEALAALDVGDFADHWKRGRVIVEAAFEHFASRGDLLAGAEARRRLMVCQIAGRWTAEPPRHPVVIAGSTGSRGATRLLMEAVARLPQGYVVLPGYDFEQPDHIWPRLDAAMSGEDHPQYRFRKLMTELDLRPEQIGPWVDTAPPSVSRNRLVSLSLRPAPVTDQWLHEGRALQGIADATTSMSLVEAPSQRAEAAAIALRLRQAVEDGQTAVLISPDRMLTRRVSASLKRWDIEPDDSAGEPLHLSAPGRYLRHVAQFLETVPDLPMLLALLKHPLSASSQGIRGRHLFWTRELELHLRAGSVAQPTGADIRAWAEKRKVDEFGRDWARWLAELLDGVVRGDVADVAAHVAIHKTLSEALAAGPGQTESGDLWRRKAGEEASRAMAELEAAGSRGGAFGIRDYGNLLRSHLSGYSVQDPVRPHPGVMIWGTLEARTQGAELVILAGLNDGVWPDLPAPDTWLNRQMRNDAGLLLPDRRIGLAAHDFQQAMAAPTVMLTRSVRDEDSETVPSRWVNRLTNLLGGLDPEGKAALQAMRTRGQEWLDFGARVEAATAKVPAAVRPSPRPPVAKRPKKLAVTSITRLIRDPYAIYARHVLGLRKLAPLMPEPDAALKGTALHKIMERFLETRDDWRGDAQAARQHLSQAAWGVLNKATPLPSMRGLWHARLMGIADRLIDGEANRLADGNPMLTEDWGDIALSGLDFHLSARPDRIDRLQDGSFAIYDYKSGKPPSDKQVRIFEKQLPLQAAMLERGGFAKIGDGRVSRLGYIGLGASGDSDVTLEDDTGRLPDITWEGLHELIGAYFQRTQGYTAIRAAEMTNFAGDYDHLARFGEWDLTDQAHPEIVGPQEGA